MDLGPKLGNKLPTEHVLEWWGTFSLFGLWLLFGLLLIAFVAFSLNIWISHGQGPF